MFNTNGLDYEKAQEKVRRIKRYAAATKRNMLNRPIVTLKVNNQNQLVW